MPQAEELLASFEEDIQTYCIGSICELYDADPPYASRGAISQAWSVGAVLDIYHLIRAYRTDAEETPAKKAPAKKASAKAATTKKATEKTAAKAAPAKRAAKTAKKEETAEAPATKTRKTTKKTTK